MNKSDVIGVIASKCAISRGKSSEIIELLGDIVTFELSHGGEVRLTGLGKFKTSRREAMTRRNPRTGDPIDVPAKTVVKFMPEKSLRESVNMPARKVGGQRISPVEDRKRA